VPLDGSAVATRAVALARAVVRAQRRPLHLIGVVAVGDEQQGAALIAHLDVMATALRNDGIDAVVETRRGDPAAEIVAATRDGDLVVMTTHGASGGQRWRVGQVAEHLLRRCPAPVLLVRGDFAAPGDAARPRADA
ncbi:MAG TPA: universal stress protein, partial [Thermomicrobiales bacterium]|nr:universal stress protein [Thermomicrobiales bacterium]